MRYFIFVFILFPPTFRTWAGTCTANAKYCDAWCQADSEFGTSCSAGWEWAECLEYGPDGVRARNSSTCTWTPDGEEEDPKHEAGDCLQDTDEKPQSLQTETREPVNQ